MIIKFYNFSGRFVWVEREVAHLSIWESCSAVFIVGFSTSNRTDATLAEKIFLTKEICARIQFEFTALNRLPWHYSAIQYLDVRGRSAPRAFRHIWCWVARYWRNDDVRGVGRVGPPHSSWQLEWWRHRWRDCSSRRRRNTTTRWLRKEIRVT